MPQKEVGDLFPPVLMNQVFDESYQKISDLITGHMQFCLLLSALKSGIMDILNRNGLMRGETLLSRIESRSEFAYLWVDALIDIGIIERIGEKVQICPALSKYLVSDSPLYQGESIYSAKDPVWCNGLDFLKNEPEYSEKPEDRMTSEFLRIVAQHSMRGEIQGITKIVSSTKEFCSARTLLDIGGGHGMYSISFCQQNSNLSAVILDRSHITPSTRRTVELYGMANRIEVISGDMNEDLPGSLYDIIFLSHILYQKDLLSNFIVRVIKALNKGGLLISNHKFKEDWKSPENNPLAIMENEIIRDFHQMIPESEFLEILKSAGLERIESCRVPASTGFSTITTALKP